MPKLSSCCKKEVHTHHTDEGTSFYYCSKCSKPCDATSNKLSCLIHKWTVSVSTKKGRRKICNICGAVPSTPEKNPQKPSERIEEIAKEIKEGLPRFLHEYMQDKLEAKAIIKYLDEENNKKIR